ncbi:MAG: SPFH domain-containing protein [Planctomycetota bacterium]|jgi:regulator of protease activity HflC (stomatin/prohibitin superfamily)
MITSTPLVAVVVEPGLVFLIVVAIFVLITLFKTARVVPQKEAFIVERLGKYAKTLEAGFHILAPFLDRVAYKHTLKEQAVDVPPQQCITKDNIAVEVDGILYMQVVDPKKASYGIDNYRFASTQLAQTTMRSVIGKLELDRTFEERETINGAIVEAVDKASDPWGVKVTRYEVKNILGEKQEMIAQSEGEKQKRINEAEGRAAEIEKVAVATAVGVREIAKAINEEGGQDAVNLRVAEQYIGEFGKLAKETNSIIIPTNLADIAGVIKAATSVIEQKPTQA